MSKDYENIRSAVETFDFDSLLEVFAQYGLGGDDAIVTYSKQQRSIIHFTLLCVAHKISHSPAEDLRVSFSAHDSVSVFLKRLMKKISKVIDFSEFMSEITCFLPGGMAVEERKLTEIKDFIVCLLDDGKFTDETGPGIAAYCIASGSTDAIMVFWQLIEDGELLITRDDYLDVFNVLLTTVGLERSLVLTCLYGNLLPAVDDSGRKSVVSGLLSCGFFGSPIWPC